MFKALRTVIVTLILASVCLIPIACSNSSEPETQVVPVQFQGKIAFCSNRSDIGWGISVMEGSNTNIKSLTNNEAGYSCFAWSHNGDKIIFTSRRDQTDGLYVMNADGSNQTKITNISSIYNGWTYISWSPDSTKIVFASPSVNSNWNVWTANADGSNAIDITNNPATDDFPSWSPDGSKIIFDSSRDGASQTAYKPGELEIYAMNADGTNPVRLTNNNADDWCPAWSPDGSNIAFASGRNGSNEIYVMNADGSTQTRLTNNPANDREPCWSPDGSQIAFTSDRAGKAEIYIMNADGSNQTRLTYNSAGNFPPSWAP